MCSLCLFLRTARHWWGDCKGTKGPLFPGKTGPSAPPHPARTKRQSLPSKTRGAPICRPREEVYLGPLCRLREQGCPVVRKGRGGDAGIGETAGDSYWKPSTFKVLISGARLRSTEIPNLGFVQTESRSNLLPSENHPETSIQ